MIQLVVILSALQRIIWFLILARIVASFLPNIDPHHPIIRFIYNVTEPILAPFRAILPTNRLGIDFSPMLAFFVIDIVFRIILRMVVGG